MNAFKPFLELLALCSTAPPSMTWRVVKIMVFWVVALSITGHTVMNYVKGCTVMAKAP